MLKRVIALEYKRKLSCFFGAAALVMMLAACAGSAPEAREISHSRPDWFNSCPKEYPSEICGSGRGKTPEEAANRASAQIARNIKTSVYYKQVCKTSTQHREKSVNVEDYCDEISSIVTSHHLPGLKKLKSENPAQDVFDVLMQWDMAPVATKAIRQLENLDDACVLANTKNLLHTSDFAADIEKDIGCQPSWRLERSGGQWYLRVGKKRTQIPVLRNELANFFPHERSEYLRLSLSSNDIYENDAYFLEVVNDRDGFLYVFMVNSHGQVLRIPVVSKEEIAHPATRRFPPDEYEMASVAPEGVEGNFRDFFIAALCEKPIKITDFSEIGEADLSVGDADSYNMHRLFDRLESCALSTEILRQKKKQDSQAPPPLLTGT